MAETPRARLNAYVFATVADIASLARPSRVRYRSLNSPSDSTRSKASASWAAGDGTSDRPFDTSGAICPDSADFGVGAPPDQATHRGFVRCFLRGAVCLEKRVSVLALPKRWVVERSFAWLEKCRRLWKNCARKLNASLQMVVIAFAALILRRP